MPSISSHFPSEDNNTIQRCPHDKENPYAMISRDLIRDESISPECRWLIIYLLSMKDGWKINVKQIQAHVKPFMGRDRLHKVMNEAIESGYIKREQCQQILRRENGAYQGSFKRVRYFVSETPKFKKCYPHPSFQDTDYPDTDNTDNKERACEDIALTKKEHDFDKTMSLEPVEKFATKEPDKPPKKTKIKQPLDDEGTLPRSHGDWTLFVSKFKLSTEQAAVLHWLSTLEIDTTIETLAWWAKTYSFKRLEQIYLASCAKKIKSKGAYMQKLLKVNANVPTENSEANKEFAIEFKQINNWNTLEIRQKYAVIHADVDMEVNFNMDQAEFVKYLIDKFNSFEKNT